MSTRGVCLRIKCTPCVHFIEHLQGIITEVSIAALRSMVVGSTREHGGRRCPCHWLSYHGGPFNVSAGRRWRLLPFRTWTELGDEADDGVAAVREAAVVEADGLAKGATGRLARRSDGLVVVFLPDNRSAPVAAVLNSRRTRAGQRLIVGSSASTAAQGSLRPRGRAVRRS